MKRKRSSARAKLYVEKISADQVGHMGGVEDGRHVHELSFRSPSGWFLYVGFSFELECDAEAAWHQLAKLVDKAGGLQVRGLPPRDDPRFRMVDR